jgi:hypothetical protein
VTLNVLVVENEPGAADPAAQELRAAGHAVLSCHESGDGTFPCRGVVDPGACPLRAHDVDVALLVRTGRRAQPNALEDGARCALVQRVPLVVAGDVVLDPYDEYATRTLGRTHDVVDACELAATSPIDALGSRATEVLREVCGPTPAPAPSAQVTRREGRLRVAISGAGTMTKDQRSRAAVRIAMALRELDPFAAGIDIGLEPG